MKITISHSHLYLLKTYFPLFEKCETYEQGMNMIKKIAKKVAIDAEVKDDRMWYSFDTLSDAYDYRKGERVTKEQLQKLIIDKVKGDLFEIFVEFFIKYFPHKDINDFNYEGDFHSYGDEEDGGMDHSWTMSNGGRASDQCKFRSDEDSVIFKNDVGSKLITWATIVYKTFDINNPNDRLIFITNVDIHDRNFSKSITEIFQKIINSSIIKDRVLMIGKKTLAKPFEHGRPEFWKEFAHLGD